MNVCKLPCSLSVLSGVLRQLWHSPQLCRWSSQSLLAIFSTASRAWRVCKELGYTTCEVVFDYGMMHLIFYRNPNLVQCSGVLLDDPQKVVKVGRI
jgi:hypothetical protein